MWCLATRDNAGHAQPAIEPDTEAVDDEGFQESSTSSLLSSIASDIRRGKVENGRTYASYGQHGQRNQLL